MNDIIVVGGGTSGCIAALIFKTRYPHKRVRILESKSKGIIGVGESSTEHWARFCQYIDIPLLSSVLEANATFKVGVLFEGWSDQPFMHSIINNYTDQLNGSYYEILGHVLSNNMPQSMCQTSNTWEKKIPSNSLNNLDDSPTAQFHFDTHALNDFLHRLCNERNIEVIYDDIVDVVVDGDIKSVRSKDTEYRADFFIDCSGFSKLLLHRTLGVKWISYEKYLPTNAAIAFPTDEMEEYNKWTKATARDCGWSWTIPTQTRTGNGYVFNDSFMSFDQAHEEMGVDSAKTFKFTPGRLEKSWYKNCFAVGLSQSFVEPLEATSIGSVIQQMFCFVNFFPSKDRETCNTIINSIFDNIVDYVRAHYLTKREDTPFWKYVKNELEITPNLNHMLELWKNRLPQPHDVPDIPWKLFDAVNYIPVLYGLNWFDLDKIRHEYLEMDPENRIGFVVNRCNNGELYNKFWIDHKQAIQIIRNHERFRKTLLSERC